MLYTPRLSLDHPLKVLGLKETFSLPNIEANGLRISDSEHDVFICGKQLFNHNCFFLNEFQYYFFGHSLCRISLCTLSDWNLTPITAVCLKQDKKCVRLRRSFGREMRTSTTNRERSWDEYVSISFSRFPRLQHHRHGRRNLRKFQDSGKR